MESDYTERALEDLWMTKSLWDVVQSKLGPLKSQVEAALREAGESIAD